MRPIRVIEESVDVVRYDAKVEEEVGGVAVSFRRSNHLLGGFKFGLLLNGLDVSKENALQSRQPLTLLLPMAFHPRTHAIPPASSPGRSTYFAVSPAFILK